MNLRFNSRTIDDYVRKPENNYLILRFFAALLVIWGHSFAVAPSPHVREPFMHITHIFTGALGVDIFFVISGFLVTSSYLNRRKFGDFIKSRCLRIFPALIFCLMATAFVLGPLESTLSFREYFSLAQPYHYVFNNTLLTHIINLLPGVFEHQPRSAINGSLWTLPAEVRLYFLVSLLGLSGILFKRGWYGWLLLSLTVMGALMPVRIPLFYYPERYGRLFIFFAAGSFMSVYRDKIPLNTAIASALAVIYFLLRKTPHSGWLAIGTLSYVVIWISYVPNFRWFNRIGDYSYGLYIYAFPIQQSLVSHFPHINPITLFISASILTLVCAMFSWHVIEKPALRLKKISLRDRLRERLGLVVAN